MAISIEKYIKKAVVLPGPKVTVREDWAFVDSTVAGTTQTQSTPEGDVEIVLDGVVARHRRTVTVTPETHTLAQITNYVTNQVTGDEVRVLDICTALWST